MSLDNVWRICDVHPVAEVSPCAELYRAGLVIEGEISDVDVAGGGKNAAGFPVDFTIVADQDTDLVKVRGKLFSTGWDGNDKKENEILYIDI